MIRHRRVWPNPLLAGGSWKQVGILVLTAIVTGWPAWACAAAVDGGSGANSAGRADAWRVWTVTETRHVLRSEPPEASLAVHLSAARNEWAGFQILARSGVPVRGVRVEAGDLRGPEGAVLPAADAKLYRQHALHL